MSSHTGLFGGLGSFRLWLFQASSLSPGNPIPTRGPEEVRPLILPTSVPVLVPLKSPSPKEGRYIFSSWKFILLAFFSLGYSLSPASGDPAQEELQGRGLWGGGELL